MESAYDRVAMREVGLTCTNGVLDTQDGNIGSQADAVAASDTGTASLIALTKRLLTKLPGALGRLTMAQSQSVTIASDQPSLPVTPAALVAGTAAIGDVGIQARASATGAATIRHVVAAASTNATVTKASAGRLLGWSLANTTAAWVYLKLHNLATAPTAGAGVVMTIGIPPNGRSEVDLICGAAFSTGIGYTIVTGAADTDTTAVTANAVVGDLFYA